MSEARDPGLPDLTCPGIDAAIAALEAVRKDNSQMRYGYWHMQEEVKALRERLASAEAEDTRLRQILFALEIMTATGEGLTPEETIEVHVIAAEGRSDDPYAWRAKPEAIQRLRGALHGVTVPAALRNIEGGA